MTTKKQNCKIKSINDKPIVTIGQNAGAGSKKFKDKYTEVNGGRYLNYSTCFSVLFGAMVVYLVLLFGFIFFYIRSFHRHITNKITPPEQFSFWPNLDRKLSFFLGKIFYNESNLLEQYDKSKFGIFCSIIYSVVCIGFIGVFTLFFKYSDIISIYQFGLVIWSIFYFFVCIVLPSFMFFPITNFFKSCDNSMRKSFYYTLSVLLAYIFFLYLLSSYLLTRIVPSFGKDEHIFNPYQRIKNATDEILENYNEEKKKINSWMLHPDSDEKKNYEEYILIP